MIYNAKFEKVKGKRGILLVSSCILFVSQLVISALFLVGLVDHYGDNVSIVGAIDLIINIANMAWGAIFEDLLLLVLGIFYIVAMVIIIINSVSSISSFIHGVLYKGEKAEAISESAFCNFFKLLGITFKYSLFFIALSIMTSSNFEINNAGKAVLILGIIIYFSISILMLYFKFFTVKTIVYKGLSILIMVTAYIILALSLNSPSIEELIYGLRAVFGGYLGKISKEVVFKAITLITAPILYIIAQFYAINYFSDAWDLEEYSENNFARARTPIIMGLSIAIVTLSVVAEIASGNIQITDIYILYNIVRNDVSMLLASIVLFASFKFIKFEEKKSINKQIKTEEVDNENKEKETIEKSIENVSKEKEEIIEEVDITKELIQYKEMFEKGLITQEEYTEKKKRVLGI